jgi:hypothetical protein
MEVFNDGELSAFIKNNLEDPWKGTLFEGYVFLSPKQKGQFGEKFVEKLLKMKNFNVMKADSTSYDRLVNGMKIEIKFSLATRDKKSKGVKKDSFIINHVGENKDWERLIFVGINDIGKMRCIWFSKEDFTKHLKDGVFNRQQGGNKDKNDDFMCSGGNILKLLKSKYIKKLKNFN